ncbi:hypothetical protein BH23ACT9_BH23ACT9_11570 [soil metagenome]
METVTVTEAKASLSRLVERVLAGEEVAIGRRGRPEVVLRAYRPADGSRRPLGDYDGPYRLDQDFFDADDEVAEIFDVDG